MTELRYLIMLDCDGTMEVSNGPVKVADVVELSQYHDFVIVGNPILQRWLPFKTTGSLIGQDGMGGVAYPGSKSQALADWKTRFPALRRYIVVDDDPSQYPVGWQGWEFFSPQEFIEKVLRPELRK